MKIGIIQGRLSVPDLGHQTTPDNWIHEFKSLEPLGLEHIEWNIDNIRLFDNPVLTDKLENKIIDKISSVCFDNLVTEKIYDKDFLRSNLFNIVETLVKKDINSITIPLVESARVKDFKDVDIILSILESLLKKYPNLVVNIESDSDPALVSSILSFDKNIRFTYDTGNITALNFSHEKYIDSIFDKIDNVHLKDRFRNGGPSADFGKGDTDFNQIFKKLSKLGYDNMFTLQMLRGIYGDELNHIKKLSEIFRRLHERYF